MPKPRTRLIWLQNQVAARADGNPRGLRDNFRRGSSSGSREESEKPPAKRGGRARGRGWELPGDE